MTLHWLACSSKSLIRVPQERLVFPDGAVSRLAPEFFFFWAQSLLPASTVNPGWLRVSEATNIFGWYIRFSLDEKHIGESAGRHAARGMARLSVQAAVWERGKPSPAC